MAMNRGAFAQSRVFSHSHGHAGLRRSASIREPGSRQFEYGGPRRDQSSDSEDDKDSQDYAIDSSSEQSTPFASTAAPGSHLYSSASASKYHVIKLRNADSPRGRAANDDDKLPDEPSGGDLLDLPDEPEDVLSQNELPRELTEDEEAQYERERNGLPPDITPLIFTNMNNQWMFNPNSKPVGWWELWKAFFLLFVSFYTPYEVAFANGPHSYGLAKTVFDVLDITVEWTFLIDIFLQFFMPVQPLLSGQYGTWITNRRKVTRIYLRGWFLVDLLSCFPTQTVMTFMGGDVLHHLGLLRMVRVLRVLKIGKVVRLRRLQVILLEKLNYNDTILDFLRFTFMVTAIVHWLACGWRMIADDYVNDPHPNWIMETSYIDPYSEAKVYMAALYWAMVTLTTIGYGDISATNESERAYCLFSSMVGALVFGYMVGELVRIIHNLGEHSAYKFRLMTRVRQMSIKRELKPALNTLLMKFFLFKADNEENYSDIINAMSPYLRSEVLYHQHRSWLERLPLWGLTRMQRADPSWEAFFSMLAGEMITSMHGMRERLAIKGKRIETLMVIGQGMALCGVGLRSTHACIGEEFVKGVMRWRYNVVTVTNVVLQLLPANSLLQILGSFPKVQRALNKRVLAITCRSMLLAHVLLVKVRLHVMLRAMRQPGLDLAARFTRFKQLFTGDSKAIDLTGSSGKIAVIKWRHLTDLNRCLIIDHMMSELRKDYPKLHRRVLRNIVMVQRRWRGRAVNALLSKGGHIAHFSLLHEFLQEHKCETYWPAFLRENINIEVLGDLAPGEIRQCTGMPMGTAVTLLKAYHANADLHAKMASTQSAGGAPLQPPPQPSHASHPMHPSAGVDPYAGGAPLQPPPQPSHASHPMHPSAGVDPYADRLVTPAAPSATGMRPYPSKLPVLNEVASRRWSSQEAAHDEPSLQPRPTMRTNSGLQAQTVPAAEFPATDGPPSPTLQRPMHPYISGIIATARSAITTTIDTVGRAVSPLKSPRRAEPPTEMVEAVECQTPHGAAITLSTDHLPTPTSGWVGALQSPMFPTHPPSLRTTGTRSLQAMHPSADVTQRRRGGQADTSSWSRPPPSMFTDAPWSTVYDIDEAALHEALDS